MLRLGSDGALTSLSQFDLATSLKETYNFLAQSSTESIVWDGVLEAPNEVLMVGEMVSIENFRKMGSAVFDLIAPDATLPGGSSSGARYRRGPYWCTDAAKLDAIEMRSFGILLFNNKGELLGLQSGSEYLSVDIKLEGPFTKTWRATSRRSRS